MLSLESQEKPHFVTGGLWHEAEGPEIRNLGDTVTWPLPYPAFYSASVRTRGCLMIRQLTGKKKTETMDFKVSIWSKFSKWKIDYLNINEFFFKAGTFVGSVSVILINFQKSIAIKVTHDAIIDKNVMGIDKITC